MRLQLSKTFFSEKSLKFKNSFYNYLINELLNDGIWLDILAFWFYGVVNHTTSAICYKYLYTIGSWGFFKRGLCTFINYTDKITKI